MQERADTLFAAFKREPEQTRWLVRFGLAGPIVIVLWDWVSGLFLSDLFAGLGLLALVLVYGLSLSWMIVRIMNASERWGVESALTARKFSKRAQSRGDEEAPAGDHAPATAAFHQAHFLRRLADEVSAARRDGSHLSVVWLDVSVPGDDPYPAQVEKMATDVAELLGSQSKTIGASLDLNLNEYVFTLPHLDRAGAHAFMRKMLLGLGKYWCHCGIAEYPKDGGDAEAVFAKAQARCEASRQGRDETSSVAEAV